MLPKALIAGATGLVGNELVSILIKNEYYDSLHIVSRRPYLFEHLKIINHVVDFDKPEEFSPEARIEDAYICLGTTMKKAGSRANFRKVDLEYVLNIARWARKNGVRNFAVISSVGASPGKNNFYLRTKGEMEQALNALDFEHLIIVRPTLLLGNRKEFRLMEKVSIVVMKLLKWLFRGNLKKYKPIEAVNVAKALFDNTVRAMEKVTIVERDQMSYE